MLKFNADKDEPPIYVNPLNVTWVKAHEKKRDGLPKTKIMFDGGFTITVAEGVDSVQRRLGEWLDAHIISRNESSI